MIKTTKFNQTHSYVFFLKNFEGDILSSGLSKCGFNLLKKVPDFPSPAPSLLHINMYTEKHQFLMMGPQ